MKPTKIRMITITAILSAIATVLMYLEFPVAFIMPNFIKFDVSELPALIGGFAYGPVSGICVCLIKNLFKLFSTQTYGVGELCNFLFGVALVVPASLIYKKNKSKKGAIIGAVVGAAIMAVISLPLNYYVTYPLYSNFLPVEAIIGMYREIATKIFPNSHLNGLFSCLLFFNVPFTFVKGLVDALLCFLIYKPLSPILHKIKK